MLAPKNPPYWLRLGVVAIACVLSFALLTASSFADPEWGYGGSEAPIRWSQLDPGFADCGMGQAQSPIDIRWGTRLESNLVEFDYPLMPLNVEDTGKTIRVNATTGKLLINGVGIALQQLHFHSPSEHRIKGKSNAMELHFVHQQDDHTVVVAVMITEGDVNPALQKVWDALERQPLPVSPMNPLELLPHSHRYFEYIGSLTTPPCTEGVQWIVMTTPITASASQIHQFQQYYSANARPLQPKNNRKIGFAL